jgi:hypothetical protein
MLVFNDWGDWSYRIAVLSLAFLVLLSFGFIRRNNVSHAS